MVWSRLAVALGRAGSYVADDAARAGAAGLAGGVLLDDIPLVGQLDPTEGGGGGGMNLQMLAVLGTIAAVAIAFATGGDG